MTIDVTARTGTDESLSILSSYIHLENKANSNAVDTSPTEAAIGVAMLSGKYLDNYSFNLVKKLTWINIDLIGKYYDENHK